MGSPVVPAIGLERLGEHARAAAALARPSVLQGDGNALGTARVVVVQGAIRAKMWPDKIEKDSHDKHPALAFQARDWAEVLPALARERSGIEWVRRTAHAPLYGPAHSGKR
jgi:hypothetical protein